MMRVTLYGWNDNSPPGCGIAYPVVHRCAGGTGTYADPITFASDAGELAPGTRIYYRPLQRYFIMEDDCGGCVADWAGRGPDGGPGYRHVDLWAGGGPGDAAGALYACEDRWTSNGQAPVIVDPPPGEPVQQGPIFDAATGSCYSGRPTAASGPPARANTRHIARSRHSSRR